MSGCPQRLQENPSSPSEDTRIAGGSEEDAAKREPLSTGMEREDLEKKGGMMEIKNFSDLKERENKHWQ